MARRRRRPILLAALLAAPLALAPACAPGPGVTIPLDGAYTRAAFHLMLRCPSDPAVFHESDLLYPVDSAKHTFTFAEDPASHAVTLDWDGAVLGTGIRAGDDVDLTITRRDPFSAQEAAPWRFRGRIRDDFTFHERTLVGAIETGAVASDGEVCQIAERSVGWFTTRPRALDLTSVGFSRDALARGQWDRFVWFLLVGPLPLERKGDPGQRGNNIELFSFLTTGGGTITAGDHDASVDDGLPEDGGGAHPASARGSAVLYDATNGSFQTHVGLDVLWDDGLPPGTSPGIRRVAAGYVTGSIYVDSSVYPAGWTGPTGMQSLQVPGMAFFVSVDHAANETASQVRRLPARVFVPPGSGRGARWIEESAP